MGNLKIIIWSRRLILSNNLRKFSPFHIRTYGSRARSFITHMKKRISFWLEYPCIIQIRGTRIKDSVIEALIDGVRSSKP